MTESCDIITVSGVNGDMLFEWRDTSDTMSMYDVKLRGEEAVGLPTCFLELVLNGETLYDDLPLYRLPMPCQLTLIVDFKRVVTGSAGGCLSFLKLVTRAPRPDNSRQIDLLICALQADVADFVEYQDIPALYSEEDLVVPLLEEALEGLTKIARRGHARVVNSIFPLTDHRCAEVRVAALNALAKTACRGDTRVTGEAIRRLRDGGHSHSDRLRTSNHHRHHVHEAAVGVLREIAAIGDQDVLDALIASLFATDSIVRQAIVLALRELAAKDNMMVFHAITGCLNDACMSVRCAAMESMTHFSMLVDHDVISALAAAGVVESHRHMRGKALAALIQLAVAGHDDAMVSIVTLPRPCARRAAIAMLQNWKDTTTDVYSCRLLTILRNGLTDSNSRVMRTAIVTSAALSNIFVEQLPLSKVGRAVAEVLSQRLRDFPAEHVSIAILHHVWTDLLVTYMQHEAHWIREAAAKAFSGTPLNDEYSLTRLEQCLQHRRGNVRRAALRAFSQVRWVHPQRRRVHDLLISHTSDPDVWVAQAAATALKSWAAWAHGPRQLRDSCSMGSRVSSNRKRKEHTPIASHTQ